MMMNSIPSKRQAFELERIPSTDSGVVTRIEESLMALSLSHLERSPCHFPTKRLKGLSITSSLEAISFMRDLSGAK